MVPVGKIIDCQVDVISFRGVEETIWPSSTKTAEFEEILSTKAGTIPSLVVKLSVSPTSQEFWQFLGWLLCPTSPSDEAIGERKTTSSDAMITIVVRVEMIS